MYSCCIATKLCSQRAINNQKYKQLCDGFNLIIRIFTTDPKNIAIKIDSIKPINFITFIPTTCLSIICIKI